VVITLAASVWRGHGINGEKGGQMRCEGNACDYVTVEWNGRCFDVNNGHSKRVKVEFNNSITGFGVSKVLRPGEHWTPMAITTCLQTFTDPWLANEVGAPSPDSLLLNEAGASRKPTQEELSKLGE
jgi:hypothetical protein